MRFARLAGIDVVARFRGDVEMIDAEPARSADELGRRLKFGVDVFNLTVATSNAGRLRSGDAMSIGPRAGAS